MDLKPYDDEKLTLDERIRLIATNRPKAARGMNRHKYAFLGMGALRQKKPVD